MGLLPLTNNIDGHAALPARLRVRTEGVLARAVLETFGIRKRSNVTLLNSISKQSSFFCFHTMVLSFEWSVKIQIILRYCRRKGAPEPFTFTCVQPNIENSFQGKWFREFDRSQTYSVIVQDFVRRHDSFQKLVEGLLVKG